MYTDKLDVNNEAEEKKAEKLDNIASILEQQTRELTVREKAIREKSGEYPRLLCTNVVCLVLNVENGLEKS